MSKPKVSSRDKETLWHLLADGGWHKAKSLVHRFVILSLEGGLVLRLSLSNTRMIRAICESEPDKFISTQKGYKRADLATDAELENARNDLMSRANKMLARAQGVDRVIARRRQPDLKVVR